MVLQCSITMAEKIIENNQKEENSNPVTETCEWESGKCHINIVSLPDSLTLLSIS